LRCGFQFIETTDTRSERVGWNNGNSRDIYRLCFGEDIDMILYFASANVSKEFFDAGAKDVLVSYIDFRNKNLDKLKGRGKVFLDSGAYSAFTRKVKIDLNEYCEFIKRNDFVDVYAGLDVIGNWKMTAENQKLMEEKGLKPLPTYHFGSPFSELERLCQNYDYIALGGLVPLAMRRRIMKLWLDNCFGIINKYWPKKIHGFGVNAFWAWERYPFYSVDATSWVKWAGFKRLAKFTQKKKFEICNKREKTKEAVFITTKTGKELSCENIKGYKRMAEYITELWKERGIMF
jgi:hypothetical protein